jgi:aerobic carbon-monoxide dehydrogenase large subunit
MAVFAGRYVGVRVPRSEDPRLLRGAGRYVDDVSVPGMVHAAFVRSDVARARIVACDVEAARTAPGVCAVLTADDLDAVVVGSGAPSMYQAAAQPPPRTLAKEDVRFVGEPIVLVLASSRAAAEDACDLVRVDFDLLEPVIDYEAAAAARELVHPELGSNVAATEAFDDLSLPGILAGAAHVVTETFYQQRQTNMPLEPRGIVAAWDPAKQVLEIVVSGQNPHEMRRVAARYLGLPEMAVRVVQHDVGGAFGQKYFLCREERTVIAASYVTKRPVKWIEDRRENLISSNHARTDRVTMTVACDADGHILGMEADHLEDCGSFPPYGTGGAGIAVVKRIPGPYRVAHLSYRTTSVWTNTCGRGAYRGPWMMETYAREQMMDCVAAAIGMDPLEFRSRNVIHDDAMPYQMPDGTVIERVSIAETLRRAATAIGYDEFRVDQARARAEDRLIGIGVSLFVEPQGSNAALRTESARARIMPDGTVEVAVGSGAHGQGLETTLAQVAAEQLGVRLEDIRVRQGDTDAIARRPVEPLTGSRSRSA